MLVLGNTNLANHKLGIADMILVSMDQGSIQVLHQRIFQDSDPNLKAVKLVTVLTPATSMMYYLNT